MLYTEGPIDRCKIAFVGEAPGFDELRSGRPFVGRAGKLFDTLLSRAGLMRAACYITNVIKEHPPGNNIKPFIEIRGNYVKVSEKGKMYIESLREELSGCSANIIVALGNIALYALAGNVNIRKRRGSLYESTLVPGKKVLACLHPASALRMYTDELLITYDLLKARRESEFPELRLPERTLHINPTYMTAIEYIEDAIANCQVIGFDIEVDMTSNEMTCFGIAKTANDAMSIPLYKRGNDYFTVEQEMDILRRLQRLLEHPMIVKVGQNIIFDAFFMLERYGIITDPVDDTMIAQAIAAPDYPKGLDTICSLYTNEPYYKDEGKKWIGTGLADDSFYIYNAKDAAVVLEALPNLMAQIRKMDNLPTYLWQKALIPALMYMQYRGIRVNNEGIDAKRSTIEAEIKQLQAELTAVAGEALNPNSPKQLKEYFYGKLKFPPYKKTVVIDGQKKQTITTDEKALKRLKRKGAKAAGIILDLRSKKKYLSTYLSVKLDADGRLRGAYNPVGTKFGRLSSSQTIFETGLNMQNLPEQFQRFLIADEGMWFMSFDLAQAENRCVAYIANEIRMINAFERNLDIHKQTAGLIFGIDPKFISKEKGSSDLGDGMHSQRDWGKRANHALNYDLGYKTFALYYEIEEKDAKPLVDAYHREYPAIRRWHTSVRNQLAQNRTVRNCFGRNIRFLDRWGDTMFKEAYSANPQSTVADKMNRQGVVYIYNNQQLFDEVDLVRTVHDSVDMQIPLSTDYYRMAEIAFEIRDSLERPLQYEGREFVIPVDMSVGFNLGKWSPDNPLGMREIALHEFQNEDELAGRLLEVHREFRAADDLSKMGWS